MKPRRIMMQAFGPYRERTECDMTVLYDSRIFLITGQTGSGKTAILDAMCFALYGVATGGERDFRDMRHTTAQDELPTAVEFEFTLGEQAYRFVRSFRLRRKRTGALEEQYAAECFHEEGGEWRLLCSGVTRVGEQAQELLSFTSTQFSQVVVLPQGEFKKLLTASSRDKSAILQVLFSTHRWQAVQNRLSARQRALLDGLRHSRTQISALLQAAEAEDPERLDALAEGAARAHETARKEAQAQMLALAEFEKDFTRQEQTGALFLELEEACRAVSADEAAAPARLEMRNAVAMARQAAAVRPFQEQESAARRVAAQMAAELKNAREEAGAARQSLALAAAQAGRAAEMELQIKQKSEEAAVMERLLPDLRAKAEQEESARRLERESERLRERAAHLQKRAAELEARVGNGEDYFRDKQEQLITPYGKWTARVQEIRQSLKAAEDGRALSLKIGAQREQCARLEKELEGLQASYGDAAARQQALRRAADENAAHLLAEALKDGAPCPVCGSREHPAPAAAPPGEWSPEAVKLAESAVAAALDALSRARSACAVSRARLAELEGEAERFAKDAPAFPDSQDAAALLVQEEAALREKIAESEAYQANVPELAKKLEELRQSRQAAQEEQGALSKRAEEISLQLGAILARLEDLKKRTGEAGPEAYASAIRRLREEIGALGKQSAALRDALAAAQIRSAQAAQKEKSAEQALLEAEERARQAAEKLREAAAEYALAPDFDFTRYFLAPAQIDALAERAEAEERRAAANREKRAALEARLAGVERPDLERLRREREELRAQAERLNVEKGKSEGLLQKLTGIREQIRGAQAASEALEADYSAVTRVYQLVNGSGNPLRVNLQNFVLGLMLDEVVQESSAYLLRLSRGRYSLARAQSQDRRALSGLDIEVCDAHYGAQRKIATLSGGELFLASLSLAFGLAEVVQAYAGGVRLDSIFIDEGFGSLDNETLDCAMAALEDIRSDGRLVGVISHVSELKERIASRIEVTDGRLRVMSG